MRSVRQDGKEQVVHATPQCHSSRRTSKNGEETSRLKLENVKKLQIRVGILYHSRIVFLQSFVIKEANKL